jgi:hypothetical protein
MKINKITKAIKAFALRDSILTALYILMVHYAYVEYIYPTFEYAHYVYVPYSNVAICTTYFLAWIAVLFHKNSGHPAQAAAALIYVLSYVPAQLIIIFTIEKPYSELFIPQIALASSMATLFRFAHYCKKPLTTQKICRFNRLDIIFGILTMIAIVLLIEKNISHMRIVSFADVYDLRSDSAGTSDNIFEAYMTSWLSYCFISYFYARAIHVKNWVFASIGMIGSVFIYMSTGSKAAILLLPITIGMYFLCSNGTQYLRNILISLLIVIPILIFAFPDEGAYLWAKSITLVRIIGSGGWVVAKYYEYFNSNEFTYYTHIGPIGTIFGGYPFEKLQIGQVIANAYDSPGANFNAGFWATDGFASLGMIGIFIVTIFMALLFYLINHLTTSVPAPFTIAWMTGFFISLLNTPLATALLSGGGAVILISYWLSFRFGKSNIITTSINSENPKEVSS